MQSVPEPLSSDSYYSARGPETHLQLSKQHLVLLCESVKSNTEKEVNPFGKQIYTSGWNSLHNHEVCDTKQLQRRMHSLITSLTISRCGTQTFLLQLLFGSTEMCENQAKKER